MSQKTKNKQVAKHMTAEQKKMVIEVKKVVNSQPLEKRFKYALRIIRGAW